MGYGMLGGVEYERRERKRRKREKKGGKGKKGGTGKLSAALLWQSRICIPCVTELSHSRELNNFKVRGSAGQKAPL